MPTYVVAPLRVLFGERILCAVCLITWFSMYFITSFSSSTYALPILAAGISRFSMMFSKVCGCMYILLAASFTDSVLIR